MRNVAAIARREFTRYFHRPLAYIFIACFLLASGYLFFEQLQLSQTADMRAFFGFTPLLFCFLGPLMSMGLFAEEKQQGTLDMLMALPVTEWEVVLGKYLAAMGVVAVAILLTVPYAIFVGTHGSLDHGPAIGGYLGLLLMAGGYIAIGTMTSAWTREQLAAAAPAFLISFGLFLVGKLLAVVPQSLAPALQAISLDFHFQSISRGVIDTRDLVFFFSLIGICLVVAKTSLESRRWR